MFKFKLVKSASERTIGVLCRIFGVDFSVLLLGWVNHWMLLDVRAPANYGVFVQVLFLCVSAGRFDDSVYIPEG